MFLNCIFAVFGLSCIGYGISCLVTGKAEITKRKGVLQKTIRVDDPARARRIGVGWIVIGVCLLTVMAWSFSSK